MNEKKHGRPTVKCDKCDRLFRSRSAVEQHMAEVGHRKPKIPCETCVDKFQTQLAAEQHMEAKGHYKNYCEPCGRKFSNGNDLKMVGDYLQASFDFSILTNPSYSISIPTVTQTYPVPCARPSQAVSIITSGLGPTAEAANRMRRRSLA
jgi:hypothetical protein